MKKTKWKIEDAYGQSIRKVDDYYCLTDLFKCVKPAFRRLNPWEWAQLEGVTLDISRRGWIFKTCWAKEKTLVKFARYLTPGLYNGVLKSLGILDPYGILEYFGEDFAAQLDERAAVIVNRRRGEREAEEQRRADRMARKTQETLDLMRDVDTRHRSEPPVDTSRIARFNANDLPKPRVQRNRPQTRSAPTSRSISHHGNSVTHHRSEPDYLTQALVLQTILDTPSHSSHRSDDTCHTPSYSHSSHDSHSWSGDSGGSYDGGGGGCGD